MELTTMAKNIPFENAILYRLHVWQMLNFIETSHWNMRFHLDSCWTSNADPCLPGCYRADYFRSNNSWAWLRVQEIPLEHPIEFDHCSVQYYMHHLFLSSLTFINSLFANLSFSSCSITKHFILWIIKSSVLLNQSEWITILYIDKLPWLVSSIGINMIYVSLKSFSDDLIN